MLNAVDLKAQEEEEKRKLLFGEGENMVINLQTEDAQVKKL